ncbi:hypothetical protein PENTCL1PPCAC_618 [Pristionchus entomophagus]|uniref:G protein-coupled receptor n=1 Tax=Pristionchus entomophagus TaxID=358040 RepID=A0AAV5S918_9BILA|nr:hypothetical protein PENTCL1PPCAC_618 [Pristionchus entomophagus]
MTGGYLSRPQEYKWDSILAILLCQNCMLHLRSIGHYVVRIGCSTIRISQQGDYLVSAAATLLPAVLGGGVAPSDSLSSNSMSSSSLAAFRRFVRPCCAAARAGLVEETAPLPFTDVFFFFFLPYSSSLSEMSLLMSDEPRLFFVSAFTLTFLAPLLPTSAF